MRIYISGPLTAGHASRNLRAAKVAFHALMDAGHNPYLPHLHWYCDEFQERPEEEWLKLDKVWLRQCEALLRLPGESPGADKEVRWAGEMKIPVYHSVEEIPDQRVKVYEEVEVAEALAGIGKVQAEIRVEVDALRRDLVRLTWRVEALEAAGRTANQAEERAEPGQKGGRPGVKKEPGRGKRLENLGRDDAGGGGL